MLSESLPRHFHLTHSFRNDLPVPPSIVFQQRFQFRPDLIPAQLRHSELAPVQASRCADLPIKDVLTGLSHTAVIIAFRLYIHLEQMVVDFIDAAHPAAAVFPPDKALAPLIV